MLAITRDRFTHFVSLCSCWNCRPHAGLL